MLDQIKLLTNILLSIHSVKTEFENLNLALEVAETELSEFKIEKFTSNNFPSLLVYNQHTLPAKFKVILNAHLDVTPAPDEFFHAKEKSGKLYGRGVYDMKAAAAVMILVFKEMAKKVNYPLGLQLVTDEELGGHNGTKYQIEKGVKSDFVLCGDASNLEVVNKSKGFAWMKISCKGATSHGAYPWEGDNALWKINHFLNKLKQAFPIPEKDSWVTTINLAKIETSNNTFNEIPSDSTVWLDIRYIPEEKNILRKKILDLIPKDFSYKFVLNESYAYLDPKNEYIQKLQNASEKVIKKPLTISAHNGGSDARLYTNKDMDSLEFGPKGGRLPDGNEWIDFKNLEEYHKILKEFLKSINNFSLNN